MVFAFAGLSTITRFSFIVDSVFFDFGRKDKHFFQTTHYLYAKISPLLKLLLLAAFFTPSFYMCAMQTHARHFLSEKRSIIRIYFGNARGRRRMDIVGHCGTCKCHSIITGNSKRAERRKKTIWSNRNSIKKLYLCKAKYVNRKPL